VIVCAFAERRWPDLVAAVDSLREQSRPVDDVVVVIDHNAALLERAERELPVARLRKAGRTAAIPAWQHCAADAGGLSLTTAGFAIAGARRTLAARRQP
jgi:hypothetical protein